MHSNVQFLYIRMKIKICLIWFSFTIFIRPNGNKNMPRFRVKNGIKRRVRQQWLFEKLTPVR